ncbi:MAG TPA: hypothetical protein VGK73_01500 [Polyangiaceae bacterium]
MSPTTLRIGVCLLLALPGCQDARQCRSDLAAAQEVVSGVDSKSIESLTKAVNSLDTAIAQCDKAGLGTEREKLKEARNQITAHRALLERKAAQKKRPPPTGAELEKLLKEGDPTCPKGEAYKQPGAAKEIRCTGPQLMDLGMEAVKEYYATRRFKVGVSDAPPQLRAERGAELYVFTFDKPNDTAGAKCMLLYPAPGTRWQEAVARATGTPLDRVTPGKTVKAARGELAIAAEDTDQKQTAKIGDCPGS